MVIGVGIICGVELVVFKLCGWLWILVDVGNYVVVLVRMLIVVLFKFVWVVIMGLLWVVWFVVMGLFSDFCVGVCFFIDGDLVGVL